MSETQGVDRDLFEALLHNLMFAADMAAIEAAGRGATGAERAKAAVREALEYIAMSRPYKPGAPW